MLPPGHVAAGYMVAKAVLGFADPVFSSQEQNSLLWWGVFWGFAPDLDVLYFFLKHKTFLVATEDSSKDSHRKFFSHSPIYWLVLGLLVFFFAPTLYWKYVGLLLWLGSFSHFILDSIEYGIPWLHPFTNRLFALTNVEYKAVVSEKHFLKHTFLFLKLYSKHITFYCEIIVIVSAIIIYL